MYFEVGYTNTVLCFVWFLVLCFCFVVLHFVMLQFESQTHHFILQEQQLYYKEITEACVGSSESRRAVSLTPSQPFLTCI